MDKINRMKENKTELKIESEIFSLAIFN